MTVKELRQLLFDVEDQDAQIVVITSDDVKYGEVKNTQTINEKIGHPSDPTGWIAITTN